MGRAIEFIGLFIIALAILGIILAALAIWIRFMYRYFTNDDERVKHEAEDLIRELKELTKDA